MSRPTKPVYRHYTQATLDAEYNNSAKVTDAAAIIDWYSSRSLAYTSQAERTLDLRYGESDAETLDIYYADGQFGIAGADRPIHVFFHGGYWQAMNKKDFSYIANGFSRTNALVVIVNYALIPEVTMQTLVDQCRRAMVWLYQNAAQYGGNPGRISVSGHSAGAHLVAMMAATNWQDLHHDCPHDLIRSGVALSGIFDLEPIRLCYLNKTLELSEQSAKSNSPLTLHNNTQTKLLCLYGELEGDEYRRQSETLAQRWTQTESVSASGHNHFSIAAALDNPNSSICRQLLAHIAD